MWKCEIGFQISSVVEVEFDMRQIEPSAGRLNGEILWESFIQLTGETADCGAERPQNKEHSGP